MARATIVDLLGTPPEQHDLPWLMEALQWAVELEFATLPVYLSGLWSIKDSTSTAFTLIESVALEEMLHLGLACNMLTAIGGAPNITAPTYPGHLPGGVRPELTVYLGGLTSDSVQMYMQIEMPEHPVALGAEQFPTIGAFYDAIAAAFTVLDPPLSTAGQLTASFNVPNVDTGKKMAESVTVLATQADVQAAIATIKQQGEGTAQSPDAPEFGGELAHYYRFGEIFHGKKLIPVGTGWEYAGDPVPFPDCYPVAQVPAGGYPGVPAVSAFDAAYGTLVTNLHSAWNGGGEPALGVAIGAMFQLPSLAQAIVAQPRPDGTGNYGPDFIPPPGHASH